MDRLSAVVVFVLCAALISVVYGQESLELYKDVSGIPCTTLLNENGPIGCTSSRKGDYGGLWLLETQDEIEAWLKNPPSHGKMMVLDNLLFTKDNVDRLVKSGKVSGILLPSVDKAPESGFSPVSANPNKQYGLHPDSEHIWNPLGNDFAYASYEIPMFVLDTLDIVEGSLGSADIVEKARENKKNGGSYPQHAVEVNAWMHAAVDTETCLRRGLCDPLGGHSIISSFAPLNADQESVLAIAQLDSNAFFHPLATGGNADMSGVIAIMLAADALSLLYTNGATTQLSKQIIFGLFTGEAWGYIGSQRFIYDITEFECKKVDGVRCTDPRKDSLAFQNIKLDKMAAVIELNQVGGRGQEQNNLFIHSEQTSNPTGLQKIYTALMSSSGANVNISMASSANTLGIPPSSSMSFLRARPELPAVVLGEFNEQYINKYYHSRFDNYNNVNQQHICSAAEVLAGSLYKLAKNDSAPSMEFKVNCSEGSLASQLVTCFTQDLGCPLAKEIYGTEGYARQPSAYTSVYRGSRVYSETAILAHQLMYEFTGENIHNATCKDASECGDDDNKEQGFECIRGRCILSNTYYHDAYSLAFKKEITATGYTQYTLDTESPHYNTASKWVESDWSSTSIRSFKVDSPVVDIGVFVIGVLELIGSFGLGWFLNWHLTKRFKSG